MSLTPDYVDRQLFATISTIIVGFFLFFHLWVVKKHKPRQL